MVEVVYDAVAALSGHDELFCALCRIFTLSLWYFINKGGVVVFCCFFLPKQRSSMPFWNCGVPNRAQGLLRLWLLVVYYGPLPVMIT
jgi:hypothetical protein